MGNTAYLRTLQYKALEWEDRVYQVDAKGDKVLGPDGKPIILVNGVPVNEVTLNNMEAGILISHLDVGLLALFASQQANLNRQELVKINKQRILQGSATITSVPSNGYFRSADPFIQVGLSGFAQINAPNYDVVISRTSGDPGLVGELEVYDKTQNGFKVKMTGSASSVTFTWTLINPNV